MSTHDNVFTLGLWMSVSILTASRVAGSERPPGLAFTIANKMALLNCTLPPESAGVSSGVTWLRPHDSLPVSRGFEVYHDRRRLVVIGDPTKGQYNLLIRRARYPEDNGTWACLGPSGVLQKVPLIVLVSPSSGTPTISPSNISLDKTTEAWTLTCASHFAFPPVDLTWHRISGPSTDYDVTLPNVLVSSDQTISSNKKLILTRRNIGSRFKCEARHPTFQGTVYSKEVDFPSNSYATARALEQVSNSQDAMLGSKRPAKGEKDISRIDYILITTMACTGAAIFVLIVILVKTSKHWKLDAGLHGSEYFQVPTSDTESSGTADVDNEKAQAVKQDQDKQRAYKRCECQAILGTLMAVMLILSLAMAFPIYFKGMTPPDLGTDVVTSVVAGSALWLDCSPMCQPASSVLSVTWRYNYQVVYHQYYSNGNHYGLPQNTTLGFKFTYRASSVRYGQVNVWPVLPGEDGIYSCEVAKIADDHGKTVIARKSFGVFVITGMIVNYALLALLGIAAGCSIILTLLLLYKCVKCDCKTQTKANKKDATLTL